MKWAKARESAPLKHVAAESSNDICLTFFSVQIGRSTEHVADVGLGEVVPDEECFSRYSRRPLDF